MTAKDRRTIAKLEAVAARTPYPAEAESCRGRIRQIIARSDHSHTFNTVTGKLLGPQG